MDTEKKRTFLINAAYYGAIIVIALFAVRYLLGPLGPFIAGFIIAWLLYKPSMALSRKAHLPRRITSMIVAVIFYLIVFAAALTASVQVTNTGKREGATVVQMYLQDVTASMSRPVKQLKGFEKITLKPGETQTVSFPIDIEALKFWNQQMKYDAEPGKFNVFIGTDSARVKKGEFELL